MESTIAELRTFAFGRPLVIMVSLGSSPPPPSLCCTFGRARPVTSNHRDYAAPPGAHCPVMMGSTVTRRGDHLAACQAGLVPVSCAWCNPQRRSPTFTSLWIGKMVSQTTATRMCKTYAQPTHGLRAHETYTRERYIIPGAGGLRQVPRPCRTTRGV